MGISFRKCLPVTLAAFVLASVAMTLCLDAAARGGGGGGGGGGVRASGAGGGSAQVNNGSADVRTGDIRSTSINNVNVERNVNVDIDRGGWDNIDHPVAAAVVVGAVIGAAAVGSMVSTLPSDCVPVNYAYSVYQRCGSTWYELQGSQYVVVNAPY